MAKTVLAVLAGTTRPLTGREVARLTGRMTHTGVLDVLNRLTGHGLVDRQEAGRALLYTLNRDHLAAPAVEVIGGMRSELFSRLRGTIQDWEVAAVHASLFGSAARGEGGLESDIDLFVVRPSGVAEDDATWRAQIDHLANQVLRWTGNHAGIAEVAEGDARRWRTDEPPMVHNLRSEAVVLAGADVEALLGASR